MSRAHNNTNTNSVATPVLPEPSIIDFSLSRYNDTSGGGSPLLDDSDIIALQLISADIVAFTLCHLVKAGSDFFSKQCWSLLFTTSTEDMCKLNSTDLAVLFLVVTEWPDIVVHTFRAYFYILRVVCGQILNIAAYIMYIRIKYMMFYIVLHHVCLNQLIGLYI